MNKHFEASAMLDYERGLLSVKEAEQLHSHCMTCPECAPRLAMVLALREIGQRRHSNARRKRAAVAACIVVTGVLGVLAYSMFSGGSVNEGRLVDEEPPAAMLAEYATDALPPPGFLRVRFVQGLPVSGTSHLHRLQPAMAALWAGDVEVALPMLRQLLTERPSDPELAAYVGIALYLSGDQSAEVETLLVAGAATTWETLRGYSMFYLANHYLRTGQDDEAYSLLDQAILVPGSPRTAARNLLDLLPPRDEAQLK